MNRGHLLTFEGGEAVGKSTQARLLAGELGAVLTREPGGTVMGEQVRSLLLDPGLGVLDPRAEALLMAGARAQHVTEVVRPALAAGRHVVSDRYVHSSLAYQGYGRGLDLDELADLSAWATQDLWPDLVVLLDVAPEVSAARMAVVVARPDRVEAEDPGFHARVRQGFFRLAAADPARWVVVDGVGGVEEVGARVRRAVAQAGLPGLESWSARARSSWGE